MSRTARIILGIDPGLAHTGWGVVRQDGSRLICMAYGCVNTDTSMDMPKRLQIIHEQISAVINRFHPTCVGIETVWFGQNITAAFATGQARGAALVACAEGGAHVGEFTPRQIKLAVVGAGTAEKEQVQYMVKKLLNLQKIPHPDHAADALAAAICYATHDGVGALSQTGLKSSDSARGQSASSSGFHAAVARALARERANTEALCRDGRVNERIELGAYAKINECAQETQKGRMQ